MLAENDTPSGSHAPQGLVKQVPGHLFQFEEKIFGMSLTQLLIDLGMFTGSFALLPTFWLLPRLLLCCMVTLLAMLIVHGRVQGMTLGFWLYLLLRSRLLPKETVWQSTREQQREHRDTRVRKPPSVQAVWMALSSLRAGIAGHERRLKDRHLMRFWTVLEVAGKNISLLREQDQQRLFSRFEHFLTGLTFPVHLLSLTEPIEAERSPALLAGQEALSRLADSPRLQALQQASLKAQARHLSACTHTRHFLVIAASTTDADQQQDEGASVSLLILLLRLLSCKRPPAISREQVLSLLRIRTSVVHQAIERLDMQVWPLQDQQMLQLFARTLAPGCPAPSFALEQYEASKTSTHMQKPHQATITKRVAGVHGLFSSSSSRDQARYEATGWEIADLLAPSRVSVEPTLICAQAGTHTRYCRNVTITGLGHQVEGGWMKPLHQLGLPLLISTHFDPIDTRLVIRKLEQALTRLESKRLADRKALRISKADHSLEAEQIRHVTRALSARQLTLFRVSITLCLHAGSRERLEQRTRYLLSRLRDLHLSARCATLQQDLAWRSCFPCGQDFLQQWMMLTSDVAATMLPATSGMVGSLAGLYLGATGTDLARSPVYLNPWSAEQKSANPHIVIMGETGQGKSWLGKTIATGLMGLGMADVVVLDKDDDYLPLHQALGRRESQRFNLAGACPINLLDLPYGPDDVDPDDPTDLLASFVEQQLLLGLALLYGEPLSKTQEALLKRAARRAYARKGISGEGIRHEPQTLLCAPPLFSDLLDALKAVSASSERMREETLERLESVAHLFPGPTTARITTPLTIFSIRTLDEKWFPLMTYVVQMFLYRHRAMRRDERYLASMVEEASYLLRHPAGRRFLEHASRAFRKRGISLITLSQHPADFLEAGQVVLANAGTVFYLGMEQSAIAQLHLPEALERVLRGSRPGECVLRQGNEYAPLTIWSNPVTRSLFTTTPAEQQHAREKEARR